MMSVLAVGADAIFIYLGFLLAVWVRFYSGWVPLFHEGLPPMQLYVVGAGVATALFLVIFRTLGLYDRPQFGHFTEKIPRIIRACGLGLLLATALAFVVRTEPPFSRLATGISFATVTLLLVIERNVLFQLERHWAKYQASKKQALILGADQVALGLERSLRSEPRLRTRVMGFVPLPGQEVHPDLPPERIASSLEDLPRRLPAMEIDEIVLANPSILSHEKMVELIVLSERNLAKFSMVPDMFRVLTSKVEIETVGGVPLLGIGRWPLDVFWRRVLKRVEDIAGACLGLLIYSPVILVAAILIKRESPGPVFYRQIRCGEHGQPFTLYKLRTMRCDAEEESGPVWTSPEDPRRTRIGAFLRRHNLDEVPQFWNVLRGHMSLVGPRPERPHFVEQFRDDISRYMWRHVSKPGMTGWAQVNGLRGNTSLQERIKYDLFYLENWSLAFDFKILVKTVFSRENAY